MEFDEMKKIWDEQNQEALYAINEKVLHKNIHAKKKGANRLSNFNDFGLIAIALITIAFLWFVTDSFNLYHYVIIGTLSVIAIALYVGRLRRKKKQSRFDRTILGEIDHAITSVAYEIRRAKTMVWWFILPLGIPTLAVMAWKGSPLWAWLVVLGAFALSYIIIQLDLNRCHIPKKRKLEQLREKLTEEVRSEGN